MTTASGCVVAPSRSRYSASSALALFMLPLSQPHTGAAAVLVDERDRTVLDDYGRSPGSEAN